MGNAMTSSCFLPNPSPAVVKLVFWGGTTRFLKDKKNILAAELAFEFPDCIVCHADSFFIGHPIPALSLDDELLPGETYFLLPVDTFACRTLTTASLASLSSSRTKPSLVGGCPFEYVKSAEGKMLIKVQPEFMIRVICAAAAEAGESDDGMMTTMTTSLCNTPELRKHYEQLVGSRERRPWSPKLETITEKKNRLMSPVRLLGLER